MDPMPAPLDDESGNHFRRKPRPGRRVAVRWRQTAGPDAAVVDGAARDGWTANIGPAGAFIETNEAHARGTALAVEILLPSRERSLTVAADVRWVAAAEDDGPAGMGVHFLAVSEEALGALNDYFGTLTDTVDHDEAP